jgi:hypothetical protein
MVSDMDWNRCPLSSESASHREIAFWLTDYALVIALDVGCSMFDVGCSFASHSAFRNPQSAIRI